MIYGAIAEPIRKSCQFWFRIQYGIQTNIPIILKIIPVQWHVFYTFSLCTKGCHCNWFHTNTKLQLREAYTYIQINCSLYPPGIPGHCDDRDNFFLQPISQNASREQLQIKDDWQTDFPRRIVFLPQQDSLAIASSYLEKIDCNEGNRVYYVPQHTEQLPLQQHQRCGQLFGAWSRQHPMMQQFLHQKLSLPCILDCIPSQHDFLPTQLNIGYQGASLYSNCSRRVKLAALLNSICDSNGSFHHVDSSLREKVSLCE